jgi:hypothetical protein
MTTGRGDWIYEIGGPPDRGNHPNRQVHKARYVPGSDNEHTEQLKLFVTPKEVMANYRPLEGDREGSDDIDSEVERIYGSGTNARYNTYGYPNHARNMFGPTDEATHRYTRTKRGQMESDEQVWDRKATEADDPYGRQGALSDRWGGRRGRGMGVEPHLTERSYDTFGERMDITEQDRTASNYTLPGQTDSDFDPEENRVPLYRHPGREGKFGGHETLAQNLRASGYDWSRYDDDDYKYPVPLQFEKEGVEAGSHLGYDRPQVLGAHHRVAAMNQINPDAFMPVEYHPDFWSAHAKGRYK